MTNQIDEAEEAVVAHASGDKNPYRRQAEALYIIYSCARVVAELMREAAAKPNHEALMEDLKAAEEKYDKDLELIKSNDPEAIHRGLTDHLRFLYRNNKKRKAEASERIEAAEKWAAKLAAKSKADTSLKNGPA